MVFSLGTFYPQTANRTEPNRTEPKYRFVRFFVVGSVYGFALFGVRLRLRFSSQTESRNRTNRSACCRPENWKHRNTSVESSTVASRPQSLTAHSSTAHQDAKESRKPPSGHPAAQRVERQRRSPQPLIPNPKSSSGGRRATGAGHGEPARRREAGGGRLRAQSQGPGRRRDKCPATPS